TQVDLILLLIDEAKAQRTELRNQIEEARRTVALAQACREDADSLEKKLREHIEELSSTLMRTKLNKFRRDQSDYKDGTVYTWQKSRRPLNKRARSVSFNLPSSATSSDEESSTQSSGSFLDNSTNPTGPTGQRGRRGGGARGGARPRDYHLRSRQHHYRTRLHLKAWYQTRSSASPAPPCVSTQTTQKNLFQHHPRREGGPQLAKTEQGHNHQAGGQRRRYSDMG
ncbi:hypothetical protein WMY93_034352, partial [Mugilogobius chulae]